MKTKCQECDGYVIEIERYRTTITYNYDKIEDNWEVLANDVGTHFHLFCDNGCEVKAWHSQLSKELQDIILCGNKGRFIFRRA
jgi:hypothetical protein